MRAPCTHNCISHFLILIDVRQARVHGGFGRPGFYTFVRSFVLGKEESGTVSPSTPFANSASKPVREAERTKASSRSPREGKLRTKTFSNWRGISAYLGSKGHAMRLPLMWNYVSDRRREKGYVFVKESLREPR